METSELKAEELRIGNWVKFISTLDDEMVERITVKDLLRLVTQKSCKCEGIPITKEFIIENGFEYCYSDYSLIIPSDYSARLRFTDKLFLTDGDEGKIGIEIKYVHDYQNLWKLLTGNELEINLQQKKSPQLHTVKSMFKNIKQK